MIEYDGTDKRKPKNWLDPTTTAKEDFDEVALTGGDFKPLKRKRGRPKGSQRKPNAKVRSKIGDEESVCQLVGMMAACGVSQVRMAKMLGIAPDTLRKNFHDELENGSDHANLKVAQALFTKAVEGDVRAQIFWLKSKGGFVEKNELDITASAVDTMSPTEKGQRLVAIMLDNPKFLEKFKQKELPASMQPPININ